MFFNIRLLQWNCRSISNKRHWLLHPSMAEYDVIMLQETFLRANTLFHLSQKIIFRQDRQSSSPGGGLAFILNPKLQASSIDFSDLPDQTHSNEIMGITISSRNHSLSIINIYSPKGMFSEAWLTGITNKIVPPFIIVGDFNAPHSFWGARSNSPGATKLIDWMDLNNISLLNTNLPTHISPGGNTSLIDLSLTSSDLAQTSSLSVLQDTFDSDHFPIAITIGNPHLGSVPSPLKPRWDKIATALSLPQAETSSSLNELLAHCSCALKANSEPYTPPPHRLTPWWSPKCQNLRNKKRRFLKIARITMSKPHFTQFKKTEAELKKLIISLKRSYWEQTCQEAARTGSIFLILKRLSNRSSSVIRSHNTLSAGGITITSPLAQANCLALSLIKAPITESLPLDLSGTDNPNLTEPFSLDDLQSAISKTRNSSPGPDGIPAKLIKLMPINSLLILLDILNNSWASGVVPSAFKQTTMVPILKKHKPPTLPASYRPIALTSVISKILERMILKRLLPLILASDQVNPRQTGFMPFRGCDVSHAILLNDVFSARRAKLFIAAISLDIKAAYDHVWIDGLILKLTQLGICGKPALWIKNFLSDRSIQVKWRGTLSTPISTNRGIPQGSVLSPILFFIYLSDIFKLLPADVKCLIFADDILLYCQQDSWPDIERKLRNAIDIIQSWCREWKMSLSPDKCECINFSRRTSKPSFSLDLNGHPIPWCNDIKFLGITLPRNLSFKRHFLLLKKKAFQRTNLLRIIAGPRWGARSHHLIQIANSTIRSLFDFSCSSWVAASFTDRRSLESSYHAALRVATGLPRWTPIPILLLEAGVPSLFARHNLLTDLFCIRALGLGALSPAKLIFSVPRSPNPLPSRAKSVLHNLGLVKDNIITAIFPVALPTHFRILIDALPFQQPGLPPQAICNLFEEYKATHWHDHLILATDASLHNNSMGISVVIPSSGISLSGSIPNINSVFTGEALAIDLALTRIRNLPPKIVILTDSMSNLMALQNLSFKSPRTTSYLSYTIQRSTAGLSSCSLVWVPAHVGIPENECADASARLATTLPRISQLVSPDDIIQSLKRNHILEQSLDWANSPYSSRFPWMSPGSNKTWLCPIDRNMEVLLARLKTKTAPLNAILFRFKLTNSPLCNNCGQLETPDHFILECPEFEVQRASLRRSLGCIPLSFSWLFDFSSQSIDKIMALGKFISDSKRF